MMQFFNKKNQVTIFIVVGMFIVFLLVSLFYFFNILNKDVVVNPDIDNIDVYLGQCLDENFPLAVEYVFARGGYEEVPKNISTTFELPYYIHSKKTLVPSLSKIEEEIESRLLFEIGECVDFSSFEKQGFSIIQKDESISVKILENRISADYFSGISIKKGDSLKKVAVINSFISSKAKDKYDLITGFVSEQEKYPQYVPLHYLDYMAKKGADNIHFSENDSVYYVFTFNDSIPKTFNFAVELEPLNEIYGKKEPHLVTTNKNCILEPLNDVVLGVGDNYGSKVKIKEGFQIKTETFFSSSSKIIQIDNKTGKFVIYGNNSYSGDNLVIIEQIDYEKDKLICKENFFVSIIPEAEPLVIENIPFIQVEKGDNFVLNVSVFNPSNVSFVYNILSSIPNLYIDPFDGQINCSTNNFDVGKQLIQIILIDELGREFSDGFVLEVIVK